MLLPDENDLTFLFEGDRRQADLFIEKHKPLFEEGQWMDDVEEMAEEYATEELIPIVFSFVFGVTIDWREYDDEIVRLFGARLPDETVDVEQTDEGLLVTYNGRSHPIRLSFSGGDRYITIRAFNEIIKPTYEIRLFQGSYMSDTHDFLVLRGERWAELERRYPGRMAEMFTIIDDTVDFP
ncbi:hypothetical protein [Paenibacillus sp. GYB003]|uniref:hypothetical protein n=1 Tax=Paenibacillus sp. GYB003 TaxID=2994392 RepID=UPI002F962B3E